MLQGVNSANNLNSVLGIIIAIGTIFTFAIGGIGYLIRNTVTSALATLNNEITAKINILTEKMNGQLLTFASLKNEILESIDKKLDEYVRNQNYRDYVEAHAKEHLRIDAELTRLRDFRHDIQTEIRGNSGEISAVSERLEKLEKQERESGG